MRRFVLGLISLVALSPTGVVALGIGEIELHSALNEPLVAEIELLGASKEEIASVKAELGSAAAFARAGIERQSALSELQFNIATRPDGTSYIKIRSQESIREPFLDFLIEVNWANGRILREYTVLLDPPIFLPDEPAPVQVPAVADSGQTTPSPVDTRPGPATTRSQALAPAPRSTGGAAAASRSLQGKDSASYGPTRRNDTLWSIAKELRPDESVSVHQMMMALLKSNPEAFENRNINNLKAGYVLRMPDASLITAMSQAQARLEADRQYQAWLSHKRGPAPVAQSGAGAGQADGASGASGAPGQEAAKLKLIAPSLGEEGAAGIGEFSAAGIPEDADIETLRQELVLAIEAVDAGRQENAELQSRLAALEDQISTMQRLLTLKDDTLSALQGGEQMAELGPEALTAGEETPQGAEAMAGPEPTPEVTEAAPPSAPKPAPKPIPPQPVPVVEPAKPNLMDEILANPTLLGAAVGIVLVLAALVWIVVRRKRAARGADTSEELDLADDDEDLAAVNEEMEEDVTAEDIYREQDGLDDTVPAGAGDEDTEIVHPGDLGPVGGGGAAIHAEEGDIDPIAEADVYLAYRRYPQAETLLKEAIQNYPERHDLGLKLLEVYAATQSKDAFEAQAEALYAAVGGEGGEIWAKATQLGKDICPDHPLFGDGMLGADLGADMAAGEELGEGPTDEAGEEGGSAAAELPDLDSGNLLDDSPLQSADADLADAGEEPSAELPQQDTVSDSLDFDLEGAANAASGAADEAVSAEAVAEDQSGRDNVLDFSLDDLDLGGEETSEELADMDLGASDTVDGALDQGLDFGADSTTELVDQREEESDTAPIPEVAFPQVADEGDALVSALDDLAMDPLKTPDLGQGGDEGKAEELAASDITEPSLEADGEDFNFDQEMQGILDSFDGSSSGAGGDAAEEGEQGAEDEGGDIFADSEDAVGTKLDLARAYIDMGDSDGARSILDEVANEGSDTQKQEAQELLQKVSG